MTLGHTITAGLILAVVGASLAQPLLPPVDLQPSLPIAETSLNRLLMEVGPGAAHVKTDHFVVVYDTPAAQAREWAERLEAVYRAHVAFVGHLRLPVRRPDHKLEVILFASHARFEDHLRKLGAEAGESLGGYVPTADRCVFFDLDTYTPLVALRAEVARAEAPEQDRLRHRFERRRTALALSVVQHEAAHHIQSRIGLVPPGGSAPAWLIEGLAMRFEVPLSPARRPLAPRNGYRLYEFRKLHRDRQTLSKLPQFLTDDDAWNGGPCYPLAWALVEYLTEEHPESFAALLRVMVTDRGWPVDPAGRRALLDRLFGPCDAAWIDRFHARAMAWPPDADFASDG